MERLFVYGTLGPGRPNEHVMTTIGGTWAEGSVRGNLHQKGWGAAMGCPAISLDPDGEAVQGWVFSSANLLNHWQELDAFEGEEYERVLVSVTLADGGEVEAYIYVLKTRAD